MGTNAFYTNLVISKTRVVDLDGVASFMVNSTWVSDSSSLDFTIQRMDDPAPVTLPAAAPMLGAGAASLWGLLLRRRQSGV